MEVVGFRRKNNFRPVFDLEHMSYNST